MRIFRKIAALLACVLLCAALAPVAAAAEEGAAPMDIWILAGQSNAVGNSQIGSYQTWLQQEDARNIDGYTNVHYFDCIENRVGEPRNVRKGVVKIGLGYVSSCIGPELGMANVFADAERYKDRAVAIVKSGAGGTWLADDVTGAQSKLFGNWASPSMLERDGVRDEALSGALYRGLLQTVREALGYYRDEGYDPVLRGFFWSQGGADAGSSYAAGMYLQNIRLFFADLREDLAAITGRADAAEIPVYISKTPSSFAVAGGSAGTHTVREAQQSYAETTPYTDYVESEDLIIVNPDGTINGSDRYHYNAKDIYILGQRYAGQALAAMPAEEEPDPGPAADEEPEQPAESGGCNSAAGIGAGALAVGGAVLLALGALLAVRARRER